MDFFKSFTVKATWSICWSVNTMVDYGSAESNNAAKAPVAVNPRVPPRLGSTGNVHETAVFTFTKDHSHNSDSSRSARMAVMATTIAPPAFGSGFYKLNILKQPDRVNLKPIIAI